MSPPSFADGNEFVEPIAHAPAARSLNPDVAGAATFRVVPWDAR